METPYGYGGIYGVNINETSLTEYFKSKSIWAKSKGVICEFTRYNPLLNNYKYFNPITKTLKIKSTIYINLQSEDQIWLDLDSKNRNMIRKAMKNGIKIKQADTYNFSKIITEFKKLYNETMQRNNASDFYYFDDEYFNNFFESMKNNFKIFYAEYESKIIATSIFIFNNKNIHYYLSGSDKQYLQLAPNNLLLYEVAKWALSQGFEKFHLGGGVNDCDQLFKFKKQFNKGEFLPFYIGRTIYNQETFDYLVQLRQQNSNRFNLDKPFLIKYRQEEDDE